MVATAQQSSTDRASNDYTDFVHTGPETLAGRFLRLFWQPVYRAEDLPPGRAVPIKVMSEDFTLYRGEAGAPHVVGFRCAHRRTQLSVGWVEGECIRCFYHGWKYDGSGQCVEAPAEQEAFARTVRIPGYPTKEYLGLIFAYLGPGEPPPSPSYPEFERQGVIELERFVRSCNYFNDIENSCDPLHVGFVHNESRIIINQKVDLGNIMAEESPWGVTIKLKRTIGSGGIRMNQMGMPNMQSLKLPPVDPAETAWREFLSFRVPLDDEHYVSFNLNLMHVAADKVREYEERREEVQAAAHAKSTDLSPRVRAGEATIDELRDQVPDVVRLQDDVVLEAQGAIPDRENETLGRSDMGIVLLRKVWRRELQALAEGRPLTHWNREAIYATTGLEV